MKLLISKFVSSSFIILILRFWLGIVFIGHGSQKLLGWFGGRGFSLTLENWETNRGIPYLLGVVAIFAEFFGGIGLITGFLTRLWALGIISVMAVAVSMQLSSGFFNPSGFEFPLTLLMIALMIFLYGPGRFSIDNQVYNKSQHFNEI